MRINKYLADCGVGSRRECDKLIAEGLVKINDKVATLGSDVDENAHVTVRGKRVGDKQTAVYVMLHKPKGYVTTAKDELGRKTVLDLVGDIKQRIYPVGRLDYDTEGLLILTNDGELANRLTHPRNEVNKSYIARLSGQLTEAERRTVEKGVLIDGVKTAPAKVKILEKDEHHTRVEITIHEGRNRQIRRMLEAVGHQTLVLKRTREGAVSIGFMQPGEYRVLSDAELNALRQTELS